MQKRKPFQSSLFAVLAVLVVATAVYAMDAFHADVCVTNDYLWYNASEIVTITVDGVPHTPDAGGSVDLSDLSPGNHSVSVDFQTGQEYNYCITSDTCSGNHSGSFSCGVDLLDRLTGGC